MTRVGYVLTGLVLGFAVVNVMVGVLSGEPWFAAGMLVFLLACQVGVTWVESTESAREESASVTRVLTRGADR